MFLRFSRLDIVYSLTFLIALGGISMTVSKQEKPREGTIKEADGYYIEIKTAGKNFNAYLLNTKKKPLGTKNITGKAQFFFPDSTDIDITLKPYDRNAFTCVAPPGYYACKVSFNVMGRSVSAKFPTQSPVVSK